MFIRWNKAIHSSSAHQKHNGNSVVLRANVVAFSYRELSSNLALAAGKNKFVRVTVLAREFSFA